ncbi:MAG: hypothetical protein U0904_12560 [Candidatus Nanopelagicales bacterium]|nr:hypothetical protein [Candidatus Nanopelagicales bacterium]
MTDRLPRIWLNGDRYNQVYLYDLATGHAKRFRTAGFVKTTAGAGCFAGRRFAAVYVEPDRASVTLQVGKSVFPLDGATRATSQVRAGGLFSTLRVEREGQKPVSLRQRTVARALLPIIDPTYDALDEMMDDFLAGIAETAGSQEAREQYLKVKDHAAGPWELL